MNHHIPDLGFDTLCLHGKSTAEDPNKAHITPIYATSTFKFDSAEQAAASFRGEDKSYIYTRWGNPTIAEAEDKIATLEAFGLMDALGNPLALKALLHASGMAALTTCCIGTLNAGDAIITHQSLYGGTHELFTKILPGMGINTLFADFHNFDEVEAIINENGNIKLIHIETPANPTLQCFSLSTLCGIARQYGILISVDNTFATPYLQQPFAFGAHYVIHSTTKFLNGHGTSIGGVLVGIDEEIMNPRIVKTFRLLGGNSNAFDAFLLTNGIRTLSLRMDRQCENARIIANFLQEHKKVATVNYLGLTSHPQHDVCKQQMKNGGAMLSFELAGGFEAAVNFINRVRICIHAVSLGTCDTLVTHPASTTHHGVDREQRISSGITDGLIRMSVGLENIEDLLTDIDNAL